MHGLLFTLAGIVLLVLENLWRVHWPIAGCAPQFTFVLVIFPGLMVRPLWGLVFAFVFGYVFDALTGAVPGLNAVVFLVAFFFMIEIARLFYLRSVAFHALALLGLTALATLTRVGMLFFLGLERGLAPELVRTLPVQLLLNFATGMLLYPLLFRTDALLSEERQEGSFYTGPW